MLNGMGNVLLALGIPAAIVGQFMELAPDARAVGLEVFGVAAVLIGAGMVMKNRARAQASSAARERANKNLQAALSLARPLWRDLTHGRLPTPITVWGPVLGPGEQVLLSLTCDYSRYRGQTPTAYRRSSFVYGYGTGAVTAMLLSQMADDAENRRLRREAAPQWRDHHRNVTVLLTERRLLHNAHGQWESWPWAQLTGFYPDLARVTLQLEANGVAPMRLKGVSAVQAAVFACWALDGRTGLRTHPQISTIGWP